MKAFSRYDVEALEARSRETAFETVGPSMTDESFAEEVNINTIVARFGLTGRMPDDVVMPQYGDFTSVTDYHTAMLVLRGADREFMRLPAEVRARFNNDPGELIAFLEVPDNRPEAEKLGLVKAVAPLDGGDVPGA